MVEDRCVQEMHIEVRCAKEFRVKVLLVKGVCAKLCKSGGDRVVRESAVGESACVCVCVCQLLCSKDFASAKFLRFRYFATIQHAARNSQ